MTTAHHGHSGPGSDPGDTTGRHGMLLFGEDPLYLSHLPMYTVPHNFQVVLEVALDDATRGILRADRALHGDGMYTFDPAPFPIDEIEPHDDAPARTVLDGTLVRGHFERGGVPIATAARAGIRRVVLHRRLDTEAEPGPGRPLRYLAFGRSGRMYLTHELRERPSFDQVLTVRFIPGTVRSQVGHPLDDDVTDIRFDQPQPATFGRDDVAGRQLVAGEVATASFNLTRSPSFSRGFTVGVEVERELHLETKELT
ncbi:hypothetical protein [Actinoplanes sp. GCM10030250]|uniref:hypothetical protein n=1 Tax=Actinoplanes sp. GCM10030250 TaxID=3273376 RepID=UPI00361B0F2D